MRYSQKHIARYIYYSAHVRSLLHIERTVCIRLDMLNGFCVVSAYMAYKCTVLSCAEAVHTATGLQLICMGLVYTHAYIT